MPPLSLLPLPRSLSFPQPRISAVARPVLTKIKLEPVNLEPLLPQTKRDNAPRELQVAQDQINLQLPTPLDTTHSDACQKPDTSFFGNLHLHPRQQFAKEGEEEDAIERGRSREPKPRRFHTHERTRPRMTPYDSESRPRGGTCQKNAQTTDSSSYARKTNLNDIAAAAAAAVVVLDRTTPSQSIGLPLQPDRTGLIPTPPPHHHHRHDHIHQQQPAHDHDTHIHSKGTNDASQAIDDAVDGMIKLYSCESELTTPSRSETKSDTETQAPLSSERQQCRQLYTAIQKERGVLALLKFQLQRDKGRLQRERQKLRCQVEKEIFAETQALKARIERLEAMVFCRR